MNIFDSIQKNVFDVATTTFGYSASWVPANPPGAIMNANVLYKDASAKMELDENDYSVEKYLMEYKKGDFAGLFESVAKANNEKVKITFSPTEEKEFWVKRCEKIFDGKTIKAFLQPL